MFRRVIFAGAVLLTTLAWTCGLPKPGHLYAKDLRPSTEATKNGRTNTPGDPQPWELDDDEPDCSPWDGEKVYCDFIDGNMILKGTSDSESIWIEMPPLDLDDPHFVVTVLVMHSDASSEWFSFNEVDILASAGFFSPEDVPPDYDPFFSIDTRCGDDVVVNKVNAFKTFVKLGAGNDAYFGAGKTDVVDGEWGHDLIFGGRGLDLISGSTGQDMLFGGEATEDMVQWPGVIDWVEIVTNPYKAADDGERDEIDCGMDSDQDWVIAETNVIPAGLEIQIDDVFNIDWNSPPGTDVINP